MDLRAFYQKLRKIEQEIAEPFVVVMSCETPDGGRAGRLTEVERAVAARLILESRARLATKEETEEFLKWVEGARHAVEQAAMATKLHVNVISESEIRSIASKMRPEKH
jgi:hypothetical protein